MRKRRPKRKAPPRIMGGDGATLPSQLPPVERRAVTDDEEMALFIVRTIGEREALDRLLLIGRYKGVRELIRAARGD